MSEGTEQFIEAFGLHFQEEGVPRIAGRLFAVLILNTEPCTLDDLTRQLQVSKGSVSANARLLERLGVAERVTMPGDRRDFYRISEHFGERILERQLERLQLLRGVMETARTDLPPEDRTVRQRLDTVLDLTSHALERIDGLLESRREG